MKVLRRIRPVSLDVAEAGAILVLMDVLPKRHAQWGVRLALAGFTAVRVWRWWLAWQGRKG